MFTIFVCNTCNPVFPPFPPPRPLLESLPNLCFVRRRCFLALAKYNTCGQFEKQGYIQCFFYLLDLFFLVFLSFPDNFLKANMAKPFVKFNFFLHKITVIQHQYL